MNFEHVIYEKEGSIARIVMNHPEKLNALGFPEMEDLERAFREAETDQDVKVVVLKGAGRAFCAGHDIPDIGTEIGLGPENKGKRPPASLLLWREAKLRAFYEYIREFPKATIAQVHGYCIYGGDNLQMMCDITIAAENTRFQPKGLPVVIIAQYLHRTAWGTGLMARNLIESMDAKKAERMGFITRAVPADQLEAEVNQIARAISLMPEDSLTLNKQFLNGLLDLSGVKSSWRTTSVMHAMGTHQRMHPGEYNLFKERNQQDISKVIKSREAAYTSRSSQGVSGSEGKRQ